MGHGGDGQDESSASGEGGSQAGSTASRKLIDLRDCLTDSPRFRIRLSEHEGEIVDLETKLEKVVTSCDRMVNNGHAYVEACRSFSSCVRELAGHFHDNSIVEQSLRRFYDTLAEVQSFHSILFDQAQRSVQSALRSFLTGELKKVKDMKKSFHKVSEELNSAINRNAHVPRSRPQEAEELSSQLANTQTQFSHKAIDYGYHINAVSCNKGHHLLNHLLSYMRAQYTFFHQGYDLLREFDPYMRHVLSQVDDLQKMAEEDVASMNSRHTLVIPQHLKDGSPEEPLRPMDNPAVAIELEGYLFKRSSGAFKSWSRRWFVLRSNQLCYQSESKAEELVVVVEDLRICTFKMADDQERRFCFEVVTPIRSSMLQADSEALRKTWIAYLEGGIARALRISASNKKKDDHHELRVRTATLCRNRSPTPELSESPILGKKANSVASLYSLGLDFLDVPGNDKCADCGSMHPMWASINLGILLCIECCGIHRNLGVHISKVRSITLDEWEPEVQMIMCGLGNARVNAILEYEIPEHVKKPTTSTPRNDREAYIRAKYMLNAFVHPHPDFDRPEIPLAPQQPSLQQLLSSNRERQAEMSPKTTPRSSPHTSKRMLSPSIRLRATKPKSYRPLSQSVSAGPEVCDSVDSDDDHLREFAASTSGGSAASMALLAENFKKLEKSGKLKNWNIAKLKAPRKSSFTQLSGKFSKSYQALNRRFRSDSTKSAKSVLERDALSDNEDSDNSSATPLLHSKSANNLAPPPKPPRTFKQRTLDLTGDGEVANILLFKSEDDDFSGDVLSAIREMGVLESATGGEEESREERFSKSLPNGGLKILLSNDDSSQSSHVSPTPPLHSPRNMSPLASEPPARAVLPTPILSPVHEGESRASDQEDSAQNANQEPADSVISPASTVDSCQTSVFEEVMDKPTFEPLDPIADTGDIPQGIEADGEENPTANTHTSTVTLVSTSGQEVVSPSASDGTHSGSCISSEKPTDDVNDGFTEFQSAKPLTTHPSPPAFTGRMQELKVSAKNLSTDDIKEFDRKRMSMISVASTDWYSFDEDEGEEDNISNYSTEFPELQCSVVNYAEVCPNVTEEEHPLFATPPTSPPLATMTLGRIKKKRVDSNSDRSSSNSPRPKSASPLDGQRGHLEGIAGGIDLLRRSCSPRLKSSSSRSPSSRESHYEEVETVDDRARTLRPNQTNGLQGNGIQGDGSREESEEPQYMSSHETSEPPATPPLKENTNTVPSEVVPTETAELEETFEDATDTETSMEESSELHSTSAVSMDVAYTVKRTSMPLKKSYSANTSPSTIEKRKSVSNTSLTRSSTDFELQAKVKPRHGLHVRSRSTTVGETNAVNVVATTPRRSLEEAPKRSKEENYFKKMIRKAGKVESDSSDQVSSFSEQDFADIFRSSLRGSKVPLVNVESADDRKAAGGVGENGGTVEEKEGGRGGEGEAGEKEEGRRTLSPSHLTTPPSSGGSQEVTVEPVIIPDTISPNVYLYQSVCTDDLAAILCAKAHGGDINFVNVDDEGKCPILIAIEKCSTVLVEFLYQNGAKLTVNDEKGRGCLHYAALADDASVVVLLLRRGAKADTLDADGKDPVQIAVDQENGDIVTLLRVSRLKQEERGNVEDQVAEVYKDFEVAVQTDPERMKRRSQASSDNSSIASRELK